MIEFCYLLTPNGYSSVLLPRRYQFSEQFEAT